jgi:wobble nucleotide-excising tRNase
MIERIEIANRASYGPAAQVMDALSKFNFIYGANGAGKTTVSRLIANQDGYPGCNVHWGGGTKLKTLVYNRDFIDNNFNQPGELKGIFTLGQKSIGVLNKIRAAKQEVDTLSEKIEGLQNTLGGADGTGGKVGELALLESAFGNECWEVKTKHDPKLQGPLTGYRADRRRFKDKIVAEKTSNSADLLPLIDLEKRAETAFGPSPAVEPALPALDDSIFLAAEINPVLKKRVIGKSDVDIAGMIQKLGNSDWVRQGLNYYAANGEYCPFCQQMTPATLSASLAEYFDETFEKDSSAITQLSADYKLSGERIQQSLHTILDSNSRFLDAVQMETEVGIFESRFRLNQQKLESKHKEPSQLIEMESLADVLKAIGKLIADANEKIEAHNSMIANLAQEKQQLTRQVWKYLVETELKDKLSAYGQKKTGLEKAILSLQGQINSATEEKRAKENEIGQLEKDTTSINPTLNEINRLLAGFGFRNFSLAASPCGKLYTLRRPDGTNAKETLSEGERSFITFLYFYYLLKGSDSESGITTDRVVVFDDPVSSLDSDILFIVGSLIKGLFDEVRADMGQIKQIFILTHNVYFHKEVTFNPKRKSGVLNEETFWTVSRSADLSIVRRHDSNPIKTSYELLWSEVRHPNPSSHTIQNTLRRILESYFTILANKNPESICNLFEGQDKIKCKSLFSWINAGSHSVLDDLYVSTDAVGAKTYLKVFRDIFEKTDQLDHYKMMMGDAYLEPTETIASPSPSPAEAVSTASHA